MHHDRCEHKGAYTWAYMCIQECTNMAHMSMATHMANIHACTCTNTFRSILMHTRTCRNMFRHTGMSTNMHISKCMYAHSQACTYTSTHSDVYAHACIHMHAYRHVHIHKDTHTCMQCTHKWRSTHSCTCGLL